MWYNSALDRLLTGDKSGLVRTIKKISGVEFESTEVGVAAVAEGRHRTRTDSVVGLEVPGPDAGVCCVPRWAGWRRRPVTCPCFLFSCAVGGLVWLCRGSWLWFGGMGYWGMLCAWLECGDNALFVWVVALTQAHRCELQCGCRPLELLKAPPALAARQVVVAVPAQGASRPPSPWPPSGGWCGREAAWRCPA
jgi:hypothetical protein